MFYEGYADFSLNLDDLKGFFTSQTTIYNDLLATGDRFFGSAAPSTVIADVARRNQDLSGQLIALKSKIQQLRQATEQNDRDFIDTRDAMPDVLSSSTHVLDTYTLFLVSISYIILALAVIYYYAHVNQYTLSSILIAVVGAAVATMV
jgi:hypothetical protein